MTTKSFSKRVEGTDWLIFMQDLISLISKMEEITKQMPLNSIITNEEEKIKFIITKTADVPVYVEYGAADIGVIGKDVLLESAKDVYELLDLKIAKCHLMMAVPKKLKRPNLIDYANTRVATKFPHIAAAFFNSRGIAGDAGQGIHLFGLAQTLLALD